MKLAWITVILAAAGPSYAQESTGPAPQLTQPSLEKIERGGFVNIEAGPSVLVAPDADADYGLGLGASLFFGWDIVEVFRLSAGVGAVAVGGSFTDAQGAQVSEDRLYLSPGVRAQLAVFTTERHFIWVRAEGGAGVVNAGSGGSADVGASFGGAVGWEYFSKLRHFSLGVQAGASAFVDPEFALAIHIHPTLRYTF